MLTLNGDTMRNRVIRACALMKVLPAFASAYHQAPAQVALNVTVFVAVACTSHITRVWLGGGPEGDDKAGNGEESGFELLGEDVVDSLW